VPEKPGADTKQHRDDDEQKRRNHSTESIRSIRYAKEKIVKTPGCGVRSAQCANPAYFPAIADPRASEAFIKRFVIQREFRATNSGIISVGGIK
jgi:hypothetical protein